jgi:hypothetical protein
LRCVRLCVFPAVAATATRAIGDRYSLPPPRRSDIHFVFVFRVAPLQCTTLPKVDPNCTAPSLIPKVNGNTFAASLHTDISPQRKEARCLTLLTSDLSNFLTPRLCGLMVRRWRLIGLSYITPWSARSRPSRRWKRRSRWRRCTRTWIEPRGCSRPCSAAASSTRRSTTRASRGAFRIVKNCFELFRIVLNLFRIVSNSNSRRRWRRCSAGRVPPSRRRSLLALPLSGWGQKHTAGGVRVT